MSRSTFHLIVCMCVVSLAAVIGGAFALAYGLVGIIEPEVMFDGLDWGAYNHNECYCRQKRPERRFADRNRSVLPLCFSNEITRERLAARQVARAKVRNEFIPVAMIGGVVLSIGTAYYAFLLIRLLKSYRPRFAENRARPFRRYIWFVFALGTLGCVGCLAGIGYGMFVIAVPDSVAQSMDLERGDSNEEYWFWIGQGLGRSGRIDMNRRPSEDELTKARLDYLEVAREESRDCGRLVIVVSWFGLVTFMGITTLHRRLIQRLRARASILPEKDSTDLPEGGIPIPSDNPSRPQ